MFTSDNDLIRGKMLNTARIYFAVSMLTALFGAIYEHFSFGVYSFFMVFAFALPLLLGALPAMMLGLREKAVLPPPLARKAWRAGIATLTVGSIFRGVLDIYGTDSSFTGLYLVMGVMFMLAAMILAYAKK